MKTSIKASMADHNEPNEVKKQIGIMKEKLIEAVPNSIQEFPWKKAQPILLDRLLLFMQEALKWSLVLYFILSSLSDVVYTFSINRELIIPVGLFVGCLIADFLKEISQELFHTSGSEVYFELGFNMFLVPLKLGFSSFSPSKKFTYFWSQCFSVSSFSPSRLLIELRSK